MSKDSISKTPFRNDNSNSLMHTLNVSDSGSALWSFPIGECTTWIVRILYYIFILAGMIANSILGLHKTFLRDLAT